MKNEMLLTSQLVCHDNIISRNIVIEDDVRRIINQRVCYRI